MATTPDIEYWWSRRGALTTFAGNAGLALLLIELTEIPTDDVQNTSAVSAQIAAAILIVFAVEGRSSEADLVTTGMLNGYLALPLLVIGTLASGFLARLCLSLGLGVLLNALIMLIWVGFFTMAHAADEEEADARLRYRLASFLDRHR